MNRVFRARDLKDIARKTAAALLSMTLALANAPQAIARDAILGTIQVKGPAYAATSTSGWSKISATRPLVAGDRLKTEAGGNLLADLGNRGVIGLYANSEASTVQQGEDLLVNVKKGKVAFHLEPGGRVKVIAPGAVIPASPLKEVADGYVEFDATGTPQIVVESSTLHVGLADGSVKTLASGDRLTVAGTKAAVVPAPAPAPPQVAKQEDERKAGPVAAAPKTTGSRKFLGMGPLGWTAVGGVALAVGIGAGVAAGGGGGGDSNASGD